MCCSESQNLLIITVLKFTRNPISIAVYIKTDQRNTIYHRDNEKRENPLNTAQKMARENSTKQDEEATTEEVPGSIAIYTEKEINTVNHDVTLSVLSLGHFISFSFATKEVKGATYFPSRAKDLEI